MEDESIKVIDKNISVLKIPKQSKAKKKREKNEFIEETLIQIQEVFSIEEIMNGIFPMKNEKTKSRQKTPFDKVKTDILFGNYFKIFFITN